MRRAAKSVRSEVKHGSARTACLTKSPLPSNPEAARPER